jgi:hypothetical protein
MADVSLSSIIQGTTLLGYTGSRGDLGYTGSAGAGFTGSQGIQGTIGYTGSAGSNGTIGVDGYTGSQGIIGYTGSAGTGGGSGTQIKTMDYTGTFVTFTGTKRWWINGDYTISKLLTFVTTTATGANINLRINKNGSSADTISITANANSAIKTSNISVVQGDYITVDVTQVGSTRAGADLSLIFEYS